MVNWAIVQDEVEASTAFIPDPTTIEDSISLIEQEYTENQLFAMEADVLEKLLVQNIIKILQKTKGREIRRRLSQIERDQRQQKTLQQNPNVDVKILPFGNMKDLKDMGIDLDPETLEQMSKGMMDQLFKNQKKKKKDDEDEEDEDPGASFYL